MVFIDNICLVFCLECGYNEVVMLISVMFNIIIMMIILIKVKLCLVIIGLIGIDIFFGIDVDLVNFIVCWIVDVYCVFSIDILCSMV